MLLSFLPLGPQWTRMWRHLSAWRIATLGFWATDKRVRLSPLLSCIACWGSEDVPLQGPSLASPCPEGLCGLCGCCEASSWLPVLLEPLPAGKVSPQVPTAAVFQSWDQRVLKVACSLLFEASFSVSITHETVVLMVMKPFSGNQTSRVQRSGRGAHQPLFIHPLA